jgi:hypothetical protein
MKLKDITPKYEKTITYSKVEKVTYKFNVAGIRDALIHYYDIDYLPGSGFEIVGAYEEGEEPYALLIIRHSEQINEKD